jgi:hypothetical protein
MLVVAGVVNPELELLALVALAVVALELSRELQTLAEVAVVEMVCQP